MQYGFVVSVGDPRAAADLAAEAEAAGWDGVFSWDGIAIGETDTYDPWIVMTAMAMRTERVRLGAILTPPSRRRPWKLARETMTLDRLSNGRLVLPVGLGALDDWAFAGVGEATEARIRAEMLDESLAILEGLWSGEPFAFEGRHYRFPAVTFRPTPVQRPRIPIWVAATTKSDRSVARALRWDGILPQTTDIDEVRALAARVREARAADDGFAIVVEGTTTPGDEADVARVTALAEAGATWWIESDWTSATVDSLRDRARGGPPR
jgi:alkanesulfonate monooxygenase SsuD/methylene tetrahydromethanopterin reductase-like flavin-dependent oxidoreductase (luciferase family)